MKIAFAYAGQGSQRPHMGQDFYDEYPVFRSCLDNIDADGSVRRLCFESDADMLSDTRNTQPALVAFSLAMNALLKSDGITPSAATGLSLGEYPALSVAGVLQPIDALKLAEFRGQAMYDAVDSPCAMVAVMGLDRDSLQDICKRASDPGVVEPTNFNCPGQIVISGDADTVKRASGMVVDAGARAIPLAVSGPFHTSLMEPAAEALRQRFASMDFSPMNVPLVFGATGHELRAGESIEDLLVKQVKSPVYFEDCIRCISNMGVDTVIEIGPSKTLAKLIRKTTSQMKVLSVENVDAYKKAVEALELP